METQDNWEILIELLKNIHSELQVFSATAIETSKVIGSNIDYLFLPFKGSEIYLLHKAFIDAGGSPNENYKTMMEKTLPFIANKTQRGFSAQSFCKYADKVDPESKETVKRFLQRMIRNIDSYD